MDLIGEGAHRRHARAFPERPVGAADLDWGGEYQWRRDGEHHMVNPDMIARLQHSTRSGSYPLFKEYTRLCDDQGHRLATLRGLMELAETATPIPIEEVEPVESILKRFATGAMSYGSISQEAHETLAIAMNRIGARSNTGEGGEDPVRYRRDPNGDWRRSAVKQVASGRFGVTSEYLVNATDLQIKMAQGAKPGEGGQLQTGRDVVIAALLGAEEYGFSTAPLVVLGCIMMRVCHLNTCPVGVATQDPELRKRFSGKPEYVVNFFRFVAQEVREHMARLGFRTMDEMIGRVDKLDFKPALDHWKACGLDLSTILYRPDMPPEVARHCVVRQDHALEKSLDHTTIIPACAEAIEHRKSVELSLPIHNVHRTVGTLLGYHVTKRWGGEGLPDDTI